MNKMVLSPMQQDYVTKQEFNEFTDKMDIFMNETDKRFVWLKEFVDDGFEATNRHIDNLEDIMNKRFDEVDKRFDLMDQRFDGVDRSLESITEQLASLNAVTNRIAAKLL